MCYSDTGHIVSGLLQELPEGAWRTHCLTAIILEDIVQGGAVCARAAGLWVEEGSAPS